MCSKASGWSCCCQWRWLPSWGHGMGCCRWPSWHCWGSIPRSSFWLCSVRWTSAHPPPSWISAHRRQHTPWGTERLLLNHEKRGDSWPPEKKNSIRGQRRGLIAQSFCVIKFYLSIKDIEKASDIDIRRRQKEYPLASVSHGVIYSLISYYSDSKECLEVVKTSLDLLP